MDFLNSLWGGVKSIGKNLFSGATANGIGSLFGGGSGSGGGAGGGNSVLNYFMPNGGFNFSGQPTQQQTQQQSSGFSMPFKEVASKSSGGGGNFLSNLFGSFLTPSNLLGAGALGVGLMKGFPKAPSLTGLPSVQNLKSQVESGGSPIGQLGQSKLTEQLNQNYEPLSQPEIDAALRQIERDQKLDEEKVMDYYANIRPGSNPVNDGSFAKDLQNVSSEYATKKADTLATRTRETKAIFDQQRSQQIQQALGASDSQMAQLASIAQLDVQQIMQQLQMDYNQALLFKSTFLGLGANLISPPQSPINNFYVGQGG